MSRLDAGGESPMRTGKAQAGKEVLKVKETPRCALDATARNVTLTILYILN